MARRELTAWRNNFLMTENRLQLMSKLCRFCTRGSQIPTILLTDQPSGMEALGSLYGLRRSRMGVDLDALLS